MSGYNSAETPDRVKAAIAVVAVHAALAAVILSGLSVHTVTRAVERLRTFDITDPQPPPPEPPPPSRASRASEEEGAAGRRAEPTPVAAPEPTIEVPTEPPIAAAPVPGTGSADSSGAAAAGSGTGAGGSGIGRGGGGSGDFSGFSPAVLIRNLTDRDYRPLAAGRLPRGSAAVSLTVDARGSPSNCRIVRSSGDSVVDGGLCPLVTRRLRFRPARDASGNPIPYTLRYIANWSV